MTLLLRSLFLASKSEFAWRRNEKLLDVNRLHEPHQWRSSKHLLLLSLIMDGHWGHQRRSIRAIVLILEGLSWLKIALDWTTPVHVNVVYHRYGGGFWFWLGNHWYFLAIDHDLVQPVLWALSQIKDLALVVIYFLLLLLLSERGAVEIIFNLICVRDMMVLCAYHSAWIGEYWRQLRFYRLIGRYDKVFCLCSFNGCSWSQHELKLMSCKVRSF